MSSDTTSGANADYGDEDIQNLSDLEHLRLRPGMYVGDVSSGQALHHLVYEVVDNSIDEVMGGFATRIGVTINSDGSMTIDDDGRGIPVGINEKISAAKGREISTLEAVMTMLKTGGKFKPGVYKTSGGLHGVGVKAVNFLSQWCEVEVYRDGHVYQQEYQRGVPQGDVKRIGATTKRGTKTTFKPDPQIFGALKFQADVLLKRLRELAFLNNNLRIIFKDERTGEGEELHYERGLVEFVEYLNRTSEAAHSDVVSIRGEAEGVIFDIAFQYSNEYTENLHSYVNNINTPDGGTHVVGFRAALTRTLNSYGKKESLFKDLVPTGEDFREGLTVVVSVKVGEPKFQSQTKNRLLNTEVEGIVTAAFGEYFNKYLEENPKSAKAILRKAMLAAEAREAAKKAKEALRTRKNALHGGGLPGKLRDCISKEMAKCEIYLVEGDSAGGSAEGGRLKEFQAILPLRGKIINAYKSREDKVLANEEIQSMIQAIGSGIGDEQDTARLRYNKVIIMTDADVDGSHIRTLLLCFFYRQMYRLVAEGHIYVAQPPLFRVRSKKETYYVQAEDEMKKQLMEKGLSDAQFDPRDGRTFQDVTMRQLCVTLAAMEEAIMALERRGISLRTHATRLDPVSGRLPVYHVFVGTTERWLSTAAERDQFLAEEEAKRGKELKVVETVAETTIPETPGVPEEAAAASPVHITELHEVRTINAGLKELEAFGFDLESLIPQDRTGSEESRYVLRRGDSEVGLEDLRGLVAAVRAAGEKGLQVTRFKGLGEMNAEELRETTLDPANRTLVQVSMRDAGAADEMFRVLMGDKVEPRREFIEKHALEVKNLDV